MASQPGLKPKPARRQVNAPVTGHEEVHAPGTVNVWTGRVLKEYRKPREGRGAKQASLYRCLPKAHCGWTRGAGSGASYCCLYFARGICHHGSDCNYLHRLPTAADEERHKTDYSHDIFGRDRRPGGQDNKGVGSYERECRTLYVHYGGAGTLPTEQLRKIVASNFAEWGLLENVHLLPDKTIAFVRYQWRSSAEFAKAAMHQQTLRGCDTKEVLDVRFAIDDPNPRAVARVQHEREVALRDAYTKAVNELPPDAKRARIQQLHLAATVRPGVASATYPDTSGQYGGSGYKHEYEGWDTYLYSGGGGGTGEGQGDGDGELDSEERWAAWQEWQAQQRREGGFLAKPAGFIEDDFSRYLRPEDHWAEQQAAAATRAAVAQAEIAAGGAGGWQPPPHQQQQQQQQAQTQTQKRQREEEEAAGRVQEALGLIGGYGSGNESEEEGGGGGGGEDEG
ncbi:Pre-mRNA-splicing factor cwc2 [Micractinium conductrix]|uniref:Pre-mRNA-splicing factor cwc2 n=1 Tax=Micractinium conductrix TaxID=554055 RepID=A0A2P6V3T3_9CHLO|nr:Pre-mRNA-splicing factor cwc2 [Micractinium conductrix]|eukprot:PSC68748.1 Pre-mRNA-splicing factor cwc2 [Micractinium conductrix]